MNRLISPRLQLFTGRMTTLSPKNLIRDSFIAIIPFYKPFLVFFIPRLILSLLTFVISRNLWIVIYLLYIFSLRPIVFGGILYFCYKKLNQEDVTISRSLQKATEKFSELLLLRIFQYLLLIGTILFPRLYFVPYLVMVEDYPIADVLKRCWKLTKGYGWQIFWNLLLLGVIGNVLSFLASLISSAIFGVSVWDLNQGKFLMTDPAFAFDRLLTVAIFFFVYFPLQFVYETLMFMRIRNLDLEKEI